jgi:glycosyltransferase involved in cell wall biosynthesis
MEPAKKVLFISHEASRTGAPLLLLSFLKWFRDNTSVPFLILLKSEGEMEFEFRKLAPTLVLDRLGFGWCSSPGRKIDNLWLHLKRVWGLQKLSRELIQEGIGLIYSNTITNGDLIQGLSHLHCPIITHVHELDQLIRASGLKNIRLVRKYTHHYIAASEAVKRNLVNQHGIALERVGVVHSAIPFPVEDHEDKRMARTKLLEKLQIPQESLLVGACGSTCLHKGTDLFIELARVILGAKPRVSVNFVWVGPETPGLKFNTLRQRVQDLGLSGHVHFVGNQANPLDYFAAFDVFALTSREDSFPLVMLEASMFEKPIVCFGCSGGAKEFVEDDCGFVIPHLDVGLMAKKIILLLESRVLRDQFGRCALRKLRERHTMEVAAPKIVNVIQHFLSSP